MNVNLVDMIGNTSTNEDGNKLFVYLEEAFNKHDVLIIEIDPGIALSSSFLNTSIRLFLEKHGKSNLFKTIKLKAPRQQFDRLNDYIEKFTKTYHIN